jgi:hypothetical protein
MTSKPEHTVRRRSASSKLGEPILNRPTPFASGQRRLPTYQPPPIGGIEGPPTPGACAGALFRPGALRSAVIDGLHGGKMDRKVPKLKPFLESSRKNSEHQCFETVQVASLSLY